MQNRYQIRRAYIPDFDLVLLLSRRWQYHLRVMKHQLEESVSA